jgi:hypothetical protein
MNSGETSGTMTRAAGAAGESAAGEVWLAGGPEPSAWWGVATLGAWAAVALLAAATIWCVVWWVTRPAETRAWVMLSVAAGRWPGRDRSGRWPWTRRGGAGGAADEAGRWSRLEQVVRVHLRV